MKDNGAMVSSMGMDRLLKLMVELFMEGDGTMDSLLSYWIWINMKTMNLLMNKIYQNGKVM